MADYPFIDLHLHAEGLSDADLATLAWFGCRAAVTCAHDAAAPTAAEVRRHWEELVSVQAGRLRKAGIEPLIALALHPSRLPARGIEALLSELPRYFDKPRVVAVGELGLHRGGAQEEDVLARQLSLAAVLRRPAIVHTPGRDKLARTRRLLGILRDSELSPAAALIDHVTSATLPLVRGVGAWAGLTLQPDGLDAREAAGLLARHGAERIVLTSDAGEGPSDLLALPRAAEALRKAGLSEELTRRALYENPLAFLGEERVGLFIH